MKLVKFNKGWGHYNKGEQAGFDDDVANRLIAAGDARLVGDAAAPGPDIAAEAMADVQRIAMREQTRLAQTAAALESRASDLDAREARLEAMAAELAAQAEAVPPVVVPTEPATNTAETVQPPEDGDLPKQGKK